MLKSPSVINKCFRGDSVRLHTDRSSRRAFSVAWGRKLWGKGGWGHNLRAERPWVGDLPLRASVSWSVHWGQSQHPPHMVVGPRVKVRSVTCSVQCPVNVSCPESPRAASPGCFVKRLSNCDKRTWREWQENGRIQGKNNREE